MSGAPVDRSSAPWWRKATLLGSLYFSQGLPFGFFVQALPVLLRQHGVSLVDIGLSSLLALPWALKFVWAPGVERTFVARIGRRRSWLLPLQGIAVALLLLTGTVPPEEGLAALLVLVFLVNLVSATQDIATDGLAIDILAPEERGWANGLQVAGYRVGMIVGGGVLLMTYERLGFFATFAAMAGLLAIATLPVLVLREAPATGDPGTRPRPSLRAFLRRPDTARIFAVVLTYKVGDALATSMLRPFLADLGLGVADIGWLLGTVGFVTGLLGALTGGALVRPLGRKPALLWFGALQTLSVAGYFAVSLAPHTPGLLLVACGFEHFVGGMATAALFTCMMDWCGAQSHATDYTIQASAVVIVTIAASTIGGASAESLGYPLHFATAFAVSGAGLLVVARAFPTPPPETP